ncbi:MAG: alcohol dehydrogenase catalytic domain-containing protein [Capsulimonadaceae bacterium]|nr:alcohol dehydrogenase catalytic domain-containing protein [Capsulimonadaceae bacterium]
MKIAKLIGNSEVRIEDVPIPVAEPGFVVIKTVMSAICGSEMHGYRGKGNATGNSGHEAAGVISAVGEGVDIVHAGDRVAASAVVGCGECDYCRKGQYTWCPKFAGYSNMHAEYFTVPARACNKLPDDLPWDVGVLVGGDGFGVPYHTSKKFEAENPKTVAIFGLGPIGLGSVILQSFLGRTVIGIDRVTPRLALAKQMGASMTILADAETDVPAKIREITGGGADVCIEAAGSPVTAKQCFTSVRTAGHVIFNGEQGAVELSPSEHFIRRDITATGSWFFHFCEFPEMVALWRKGLPVETLITHTFPIDRIGEAYRAMEGESGKVIVTYG